LLVCNLEIRESVRNFVGKGHMQYRVRSWELTQTELSNGCGCFIHESWCISWATRSTFQFHSLYWMQSIENLLPILFLTWNLWSLYSIGNTLFYSTFGTL